MKLLSHGLAVIIGILLVPVIAGAFYLLKSEEIATQYQHRGKVIAVTSKYQYYNCPTRGFMMIELNPLKKLVVVCGHYKKPGDKISITLDTPNDYLMQYRQPDGVNY